MVVGPPAGLPPGLPAFFARFLDLGCTRCPLFAASADWGASADNVAPLADRIERGARELADAVARREPAKNTDPFDPANYLGEGRSFGHLLGVQAG